MLRARRETREQSRALLAAERVRGRERAPAEVVIDDLARVQLLGKQRDEVGHRFRDRLVVDRARGLEPHERRLVLEELRDARIAAATEDDDGHEAHVDGRILRRRDQPFARRGILQPGDRAEAQRRIAFARPARELDQGLDGGRLLDAAQSQGGEEPDARVRILEELHEAVGGSGLAQVAEDPRRLRAYLRVAVGEPRQERVAARGGIAAAHDAHPPHAVERREERHRAPGRLAQRREAFLAARRELELRFLPHALVFVREEAGELGDRTLRHALAEQLLHLGDDRVGAVRRLAHAVDPALARRFPPVDPICCVHRAVGSEVAVGRAESPREVRRVDEVERRALRREIERVDAAEAGRAFEIDEEEAALPLLAPPGAGVDAAT